MKRKHKKIGRTIGRSCLTVGGLALAGAALYTDFMTSVVARRRNLATDTVMTLATKRHPDDIDPIYEGWASTFKASVTEKVSIVSFDELTLQGHWYPVEGATRTVICAHGWHSRWNLDFSGIGPFLHENGCNVLLIEQRAHGDSEGELISYGIRERYDVLSWLDWLDKHHGGLPVYLYGVSMGAATVLMTATLPIAGRVCGIISDCGYSDPQEIVSLTLEASLGKFARPTATAINLNCKLREKFTLSDYSPIQAMRENTEIPCLFIHGDADKTVPCCMSVENYAACQAPKELLLVEGADHAMSFVITPDAYKQTVLRFFATHDPAPIPEPEPDVQDTPKSKKRGRRA